MKKMESIKKAEEMKGKTKVVKGDEIGSERVEKLEQRKEAREKLPPFPEPKPGEDISTGSPMEEAEEKVGDYEVVDLEETCGNLWVVLYQLGGILKKGFEPLTPDVKNLLAPPTARLAKKYHVETYMKDELMLAGILGIDLSKRLLKKPKAEVERK